MAKSVEEAISKLIIERKGWDVDDAIQRAQKAGYVAQGQNTEITPQAMSEYYSTLAPAG